MILSKWIKVQSDNSTLLGKCRLQIEPSIAAPSTAENKENRGNHSEPHATLMNQ